MTITVDHTGISAAAFTVTLNASANSVIYAFVQVNAGSAAFTGGTLSDNSGNGITYTQRAAVPSGNTVYGVATFYGVNTGAAISGATLTFSPTNGGSSAGLGYVSFLGVNLSTPIDPNGGLPVTGRFAGGADPLSVNTNATQNAILGCFGFGVSTAAAGTSPTTYTPLYDANTGGANGTVFEYAILTNGPQSSLSVNISGSGAVGQEQAGIADALQAAPPTPPTAVDGSGGGAIFKLRRQGWPRAAAMLAPAYARRNGILVPSREIVRPRLVGWRRPLAA